MTQTQVLLVTKPNCFACRITLTLLEELKKKYKYNFDISVKCTTDLTKDESLKYDTFGEYPTIHFIKDNIIKYSCVGSKKANDFKELVEHIF